MARPIYAFGNGQSEGNAGMRALLGVRGAHKCELANLGLPVAPGFCITQKCLQPAGGDRGPSLSDEARNAIKLAVSELEDMCMSERRFGHLVNPLLLSIQSDAKVPPIKGFTGVVANIGLNDNTVQGWQRHESPHFVWDSYRRLISSFSRAVKRLDMEPFERELSDIKSRLNAQCQLGGDFADCHIPTQDLRDLVERYKEIYKSQTGEAFPQEPETQLWEAVRAASRGWGALADECTEAVTVQTTIRGNQNFRSAVGVTFIGGIAEESADGTCEDSADELCEPVVHGEWLLNAQSEDLAGDRTRLQVTREASCQWAEEQGVTESQRRDEFPSLEETYPSIFAKLLRCQDTVESHIEDVQGLEFAVEEGQLWLLQTRICGEDEQPLCARELEHSQKDIMEIPEHLNTSDVETCEPNTPQAGELYEDVWPDAELQLDFEVLDAELCSEHVPTQDLFAVDATMEHVGVQQERSAQCSPSTEPPSVFADPQAPTQEPREFAIAEKPSVKAGGARRSRFSLGSVMRRFGLRSRRAARPPAPKPPRQAPPSSIDSQAPLSVAERCRVAHKVNAGLLVLPLWQTMLAGGAGAVGCRTLGSSMELFSGLKSALMAGRSSGTSLVLAPSFSLQQGLRAFAGPAGPARAFPTGAVCCTIYANLSCKECVDDSPLLRLGCAALAVRVANAVTQPAGGSIFGSLRNRNFCFGPTLSKMVPTLAIEMCAMDLVRNAAVVRGHDVTPGLLIASGAAAGTIAQTVVHPLNALHNRVGSRTFSAAMQTVAKEGASSLFTGFGPACLRSMPIAAMNSLVRVGMVTQFADLARNAP